MTARASPSPSFSRLAVLAKRKSPPPPRGRGSRRVRRITSFLRGKTLLLRLGEVVGPLLGQVFRRQLAEEGLLAGFRNDRVGPIGELGQVGWHDGGRHVLVAELLEPALEFRVGIEGIFVRTIID